MGEGHIITTQPLLHAAADRIDHTLVDFDGSPADSLFRCVWQGLIAYSSEDIIANLKKATIKNLRDVYIHPLRPDEWPEPSESTELEPPHSDQVLQVVAGVTRVHLILISTIGATDTTTGCITSAYYAFGDFEETPSMAIGYCHREKRHYLLRPSAVSCLKHSLSFDQDNF
ncbi:hypothetical protein V865_000193 [Kwoniella europaea PYCC6329]|uniref:Uncharacterized protein n=1 Tax=Kwoniella europaea PYCC6329 TaxID=1423913 RepID=A0AAX4K9C8_9TREE